MENIFHFSLKALRKIIGYTSLSYKPEMLSLTLQSPDEVSEYIYRLLISDKPCMVARYGSTELLAICNFLGILSKKHSWWKFVTGKQLQWWWNRDSLNQLQKYSGFFPVTTINVAEFCGLMLHCSREIDLLGSWITNESHVKSYLQNAQKCKLRDLEPFWAQRPWSRALANKKVVVVHPFAETIELQYKENRTRLFANKEVLPEFSSLRTVKAVQSLGGGNGEFHNWFEALRWMENEIDKEDYDVCLIGCGAYGFPLAAHVKRMGKKAVHLGGALQLLFGIKGRRWEDPNYGVEKWGIPYGSYLNLMNEYWVRPSNVEKPKSANNVENACYW